MNKRTILPFPFVPDYTTLWRATATATATATAAVENISNSNTAAIATRCIRIIQPISTRS